MKRAAVGTRPLLTDAEIVALGGRLRPRLTVNAREWLTLACAVAAWIVLVLIGA